MSCPSDQTRLAALLGELSVNDARALEAHRAGCAACQEALREHQQLLADLSAAPEHAIADDDFTARVMAACAVDAAPPVPVKRRQLVRSASLALAACAAAWLVVAPFRESYRAYQARGVTPSEHQDASADLLYLRESVLHSLSGAALRPGDALAVRYTNAGAEPKYLAVFALDARHELHWVYPAWVDARDNPGSVALAPETRDQLLDEVVEPDAPAAGALTVFALLTDAPLHVRDVEAVRAELSVEKVRSLFAGADVRTWRATWNRD